MKLSDLKEMTVKTTDPSSWSKKFFDNEIKKIDQYQHTADIEHIKVFKKDYKKNGGIIYLLILNEEPVGFYQILELESNKCELSVAYLDEKFRRQKITQKFLFFLKTREHYSTIRLGEYHSPGTVELVKTLPRMFDVYCVKDGEKIEYNKNEIDKYYSKTYDTGWQIVLENDCKTMIDWPRFFEERDPGIKKFYSFLLKNINAQVV